MTVKPKRSLVVSFLALLLALTVVAGSGAAAGNSLVLKMKDGSTVVVDVAVDASEIESVDTGSVSLVPGGVDTEKPVIARVGSVDITFDEFYGSMAQLHGEEALMQLLAEAAIHNAAREKNVSVSPDQITVELNAIKDQLGDSFEVALMQYNMTEAELVSNIELSMLAVEIANAGVEITDAEIELYYKSHKTYFTIPEQIRASHILVQTAEEAQAIVDALKEGASFADLASQKSIDTGTASLGGDLGYFTMGEMIQEFEDAAFALKTGETSAPVRTNYGYHVIMVSDRKPAKEFSLDEVRDDVVIMIKQDRTPDLNQLVSELMAVTPVTVFDKRFEYLGNSVPTK
jgi:foldase protein PrsA